MVACVFVCPRWQKYSYTHKPWINLVVFFTQVENWWSQVISTGMATIEANVVNSLQTDNFLNPSDFQDLISNSHFGLLYILLCTS